MQRWLSAASAGVVNDDGDDGVPCPRRPRLVSGAHEGADKSLDGLLLVHGEVGKVLGHCSGQLLLVGRLVALRAQAVVALVLPQRADVQLAQVHHG